MPFRNYIREFFLFHWSFGIRKHGETKHNVSDTTTRSGNGDINDLDPHTCFCSRHENRYSRYDNHNYGHSQSYDDFHDEQDDYDMMDDDF